jgi:hypothetical protein
MAAKWLWKLKPEAIQITLSCYYTCRDSCNNYSTLIHRNKSHHSHFLGTDAYFCSCPALFSSFPIYYNISYKYNTRRISQGFETRIFWNCCSNKLLFSNLLGWIFLTDTSVILKKYCCLSVHCWNDLQYVWNYCSCLIFEKNSSDIHWLGFRLVRILHLVHVLVHALASLD